MHLRDSVEIADRVRNSKTNSTAGSGRNHEFVELERARAEVPLASPAAHLAHLP